MPTTQSQIEEMKAMATRLAADPSIKFAYVDDWGRFGNFQLFVTPLHHDRSTTLRLRALVRKALPGNANLRECFGPDPIREYSRYSRSSHIVGYSRSYWVFDVDYQHYDRETNSFH